jgi:rRNA-processing protein FCF1
VPRTITDAQVEEMVVRTLEEVPEGAVYDALVALAAKEHRAALATRDVRARGTYDAIGVEVIVVT